MLNIAGLIAAVSICVSLAVSSNPVAEPGPDGKQASTRDCIDCPDIVSVPGVRDGGGSLWVAVNETTWAEYLASVKAGACDPPHLLFTPDGETKANMLSLLASSHYAVVGVSFDKIECFAGWLSAKKGRHYRLPTEAEWERFARAGVTTRFPWGNDLLPEKAALRLHTKLKGNAPLGIGLNSFDGLQVRTFPPNRVGLYDVIGNSFELTSSCREPELDELTLKVKLQRRCSFIIRGGSYNWTLDKDLGLSSRLWVKPSPEMNEAGFRLVAE